MANVIKHKRGSGSDPVANDLVVGEVAIRTDVGKLFTKMDNGSVAEIAGGGSDIAINTLSSSSGTGGGSATFNGSAFRFTLSSPPSVSAQQLLVSINGVIQKPVAGTGQPSEGFSVDGTDIILGDAPETGADFFILTFKSLGVSEPADNSVTSAKIVDGAIVNADINASAAIAGTKVSPDFGSQTITTTGRLLLGTTVDNSFKFKVSDGGGFEFAMLPNDSGVNNFTNYDRSNNAYVPLSTNASEHRFGISGAEKMRIDSSGRVGIGTTSPSTKFVVSNSGAEGFEFSHSSGTNELNSFNRNTSGRSPIDIVGQTFKVITGNPSLTTGLFQDSVGRVGIGTTDPSASDNFADDLTVTSSDSNVGITILGSTSSRIHFGDGTSGDADRRGQINYLHSDDAFAFLTSATERMRIDSSGNVGIGASSPAGKFHVNLGTDKNIVYSGGIGEIGNVAGFQTVNDALSANTGFGIRASEIRFAIGSSERMRIDSSGNLSIGETGEPAAGTDGIQLRADGTVKMSSTGSGERNAFEFKNANGVVGKIVTQNSATTFSTNSDYRLKENVVAISDGISRLKQLKPSRFNFIVKKDSSQDGFLAHEVQAVVPEAICGQKDAVKEDGSIDPQGIDQGKLVPLLVAALQEAIGRIEALEAK